MCYQLFTVRRQTLVLLALCFTLATCRYIDSPDQSRNEIAPSVVPDFQMEYAKPEKEQEVAKIFKQIVGDLDEMDARLQAHVESTNNAAKAPIYL